MNDIQEMADHEILDASAREIRRAGLYRGGFSDGNDDGPVCGMGAMRRVAFGCAAASVRSPFDVNGAAYFTAEEALAKVMVEQLGVPKVHARDIVVLGNDGQPLAVKWSQVGALKTPFDIIKEGNDEYAVDAEDIALCMEKAAAELR